MDATQIFPTGGHPSSETLPVSKLFVKVISTFPIKCALTKSLVKMASIQEVTQLIESWLHQLLIIWYKKVIISHASEKIVS